MRLLPSSDPPVDTVAVWPCSWAGGAQPALLPAAVAPVQDPSPMPAESPRVPAGPTWALTLSSGVGGSVGGAVATATAATSATVVPRTSGYWVRSLTESRTRRQGGRIDRVAEQDGESESGFILEPGWAGRSGDRRGPAVDDAVLVLGPPDNRDGHDPESE